MYHQKETPTSVGRPGVLKCALRDGESDLGDSKPALGVQEELTALLFYQDPGRYNVTFGGLPVMTRSADPETDLARALLERGLSGTVTLRDGKTGTPRTFIDIERAAAHRTVETSSAPRLRRLTCAERAQAAERSVADRVTLEQEQVAP